METTTLPPETSPNLPLAGAPRMVSVDVFRGLVMFLMMAEVLELCRVARNFPGDQVWQLLCLHQSHSEWIGCTLHDLIQPAFSFLVGVALPFSIANRVARGQKFAGLFGHALWRALLLILLGVFLRSVNGTQTNWTFEDTLTQIGLGYLALFLLGFRSMKVQWIALVVVLAGYWAAFALYPLPPADFDYGQVGVSAEWLRVHGQPDFAAHWQKNANLAWHFDTWFLNLFPRSKPFVANEGGYTTLNFIPTLGTMILGLIAGGILRCAKPTWQKFFGLALLGGALLAIGWQLGELGYCPVVKRIWTPTWALYSGGWCLLILAAFYLVLDVAKIRFWAFPLRVIGMNSIAAYLMYHLFRNFILESWTLHAGSGVFKLAGDPYEILLRGAAVLITMWLILFWMYRQKFFVKI